MFVCHQNVCQTTSSSRLSVGGWWTRPLSVALLMRHGWVRVVDAVRGAAEGGFLVCCQCESALFPALDAWSVSLVTADLSVFSLSLTAASASSAPLWSCTVLRYLWFFSSFLFAPKPSIRHTSLALLFSHFTPALHLNPTAALRRVLCSLLSVSICRCNTSRRTAAHSGLV